MIMSYRIAAEADVGALALMRWVFRLEEAPGTPRHDQASFLDACSDFLQQGLAE